MGGSEAYERREEERLSALEMAAEAAVRFEAELEVARKRISYLEGMLGLCNTVKHLEVSA